MKKTYQGSCVCGAIRFECQLDLSKGTTRCNCSFCRKARMWFAIVKEPELKVLQGADLLLDFQRTQPGKPAPFLHFNFCSRCGVRPFTKGGALPQFGGEFYAVNVMCLDNATDEELSKAPIQFADGRHDRWDVDASETHYL
jgi:hypothetical protein